MASDSIHDGDPEKAQTEQKGVLDSKNVAEQDTNEVRWVPFLVVISWEAMGL